MNDRRDPRTFAALVAHYPPDVAALAHAARDLVFDVLPGAYEIVWPVMKVAGYGTGPKKMTQHFVWLAPFAQHLTFGFYYGAQLDDPAGLLEGTGASMRHVKVRTAADLRNPALRPLLVASTKHRVPPLRDGDEAAADLAAARKAALAGPAKKRAPAAPKGTSAKKATPAKVAAAKTAAKKRPRK